MESSFWREISKTRFFCWSRFNLPSGRMQRAIFSRHFCHQQCDIVCSADNTKLSPRCCYFLLLITRLGEAAWWEQEFSGRFGSDQFCELLPGWAGCLKVVWAVWWEPALEKQHENTEKQSLNTSLFSPSFISFTPQTMALFSSPLTRNALRFTFFLSLLIPEQMKIAFYKSKTKRTWILSPSPTFPAP